MSIACRLCVVSRGLKMGESNQSVFETEDALADHLEVAHHMIVVRKGETAVEADRRVLATGQPCPDCVIAITKRLEGTY